MATPIAPQLSISATQLSMRERCPRRWWLRYVGHWGGWMEGASAEAAMAYRLGKLESFSTWTGKRVHDGIGRLLRQDDAVASSVGCEIGLRMRREFRESSGVGMGRFGDPKRFRLAEHYFGSGMADAECDRCIREVEECVMRFDELCKSEPSRDFRAWARSARDGRRFLHVDHEQIPIEARGFTDRELGRGVVTAYFAPDFAVETGDGSLVVIDWKTGARWGPSDDELTSQLDFYAAWLWLKCRPAVDSARSIELYEYHLPDGRHAGRQADVGELEAAAGRIRARADEMVALRGTSSCVPRGACPTKPDPIGCAWCPFRGICPDGAACLAPDGRSDSLGSTTRLRP